VQVKALREMDRMKSDQPLVSVAMVTRNVEQYLEEAIESVLNQSFRDFEFIIVDFGSTDGTKDIIQRYARQDGRIRCQEIPECTVAFARNAACRLARGQYIAIQDADDISLTHRLSCEVEFLASHPGTGLVGSEIQRIDGDGNPLKTVNDLPTDDDAIKRELATWNPFWQPTVLFRRDAFVEAGGYRNLYPSEDYDLWLRIAERYRCANLHEILLNYRIHSNQVSVRRRKEQILRSLAARASVALRRARKADPLDAGAEPTPALLEEMGVSLEQQHAAIIQGYAFWVKQLYASEEYSSVKPVAIELAQECKGRHDERPLVANALLMASKAEWKQGRIFSSFAFLCRGAGRNPRILAGPLRGVFGRGRRRELGKSDAKEIET
jgi:glycosyltransferase involved in cell wall biosynthesis